MLGIVGVGARIVVHDVALERAVDQNRQFARRGGDRFGLANPRRQSPIVQPARYGRTVLFVAPSTSAAANGAWDPSI